MTQDIAALVERLRDAAKWTRKGNAGGDEFVGPELLEEAADAIERLERERDEARNTNYASLYLDEVVRREKNMLRAAAAEKDAAELRTALAQRNKFHCPACDPKSSEGSWS